MSIEGFKYLLDKNEVVATASALDLIERPESVESGYRRAVRTFVPMSRFAEGGALTVEDFEKRVIKQVRDGRTPRGYISAGYGYGKTSTALYLWQQAEAANLLAVPPFQLEKLPHLIDALYGWARYRLAQRQPAAVTKLEAAYTETVSRSLDGMAKRFNVSPEQAQQMLQEGVLTLETQPNDYVRFFDRVTTLAKEVGYDGVLLLPDEIQQFFRSNNERPQEVIARLFNVLQLLGTREADSSLSFGLIFSMTPTEMGIIRDTHRRGDLLARLRDLSIDLTQIYTARFARVLWDELAKTFDFTAEAPAVIPPETLIALGNISSNIEISDGPRTVVNVLKRAVTVYLDRQQHGFAQPYTPIDLIEDFLDEQKIHFAGNDRLRNVTRRHLAHPFVQANPLRYGPAVKLIGAFGVEGVPLAVQTQYEQADAIAELMSKTLGDVVRVGSNLAAQSVALVGLDDAADPSWMKETIRNFRLGWNPTSRETRERTFAAFKALLLKRVFTKAKVLDERAANMVANHALILELDAQGQDGRRFPKRRMHVRLLWNDEPIKDSAIDGDLCLEYRLGHYEHLAGDERRRAGEAAYQSDQQAYTITLPLNLYYTPEDALTRVLYDQLRDVWSPYELSPFILLNLYQLMQELHEAGDMPKTEAPLILNSFVEEFLDYARDDLFNALVGEPVQSSGPQISEMAVRTLLTQRFPDYVTLMNGQNWNSQIGKYRNALNQLDNGLLRRGDELLSVSKDKLGDLLAMSNTGLDSFAASYGALLTIGKPDRTGTVSARFTLHPLETLIVGWLSESQQVVASGKSNARRIARSKAAQLAETIGYQPEEVEKACELLAARELIILTDDWITELVNETISLEALKTELTAITAEIQLLANAFPSATLGTQQTTINRVTEVLTEQARLKNPDAARVTQINNTLKTVRTQLTAFTKDRVGDLRQRVQRLPFSGLRPNERTQLEQPLTYAVDYVDQVNVLRVRLLEMMEKVEKRLHTHQQAVSTLLTELRPDIALPMLVQAGTQVKELESEREILETQFNTVRGKFEHFQQWVTLVKGGAAVQRDLEELRLPGTDDLRDRLKDLSIQIRGEISARKQDALTEYGPFMVTLETLRRDVDVLRQNASAAFHAQRDAYAALLTSIGQRPDSALTALAFNPSDPGSVYALAVKLTHQQIARSAEELPGTITARQQMAANLMRRAEALSAHEKQDLIRQVTTISEHLAVLQTQVLALVEHVPALAAETTLNQHGPAFATEYRSIRTEADALHRQLEALRGTVGQLEPTPIEARLHDCLLRLQSNGSGVDIFTLQVSFEDDGDAFWSALRGLSEKDAITLNVTLPSLLAEPEA